MLEEIRKYVMQRLWDQSVIAMKLEDTICPTIRKHLQLMVKSRGNWHVYRSGLHEFEVQNIYGNWPVDVQARNCACRMWDITGIPCIHAIVCLAHLNIDPDEFVSHWYSKEMWIKTYSHQIKTMYGSSMWKKVDGLPILPPKGRRMPGRPKKKRIRHPSENDGKESVTRMGRNMTCSKCFNKGHNKATCTSEPKDPPQKEFRKPGRPRKPLMDIGCFRHRGTGRGRSSSATYEGGTGNVVGSGRGRSSGATNEGGTRNVAGTGRGRGNGGKRVLVSNTGATFVVSNPPRGVVEQMQDVVQNEVEETMESQRNAIIEERPCKRMKKSERIVQKKVTDGVGSSKDKPLSL